MDKLLSQFRRIYSDNGKGDVDFSEAEEKLRQSRTRLNQATQELVKASQHLNNVAMGVDIPDDKQMH